MAYRVDLTGAGGPRPQAQLHLTIKVEDAAQARTWFNGLEKAILSLDEHPARGAPTPKTATSTTCFTGAQAYTNPLTLQLAVATLNYVRVGRAQRRGKPPKTWEFLRRHPADFRLVAGQGRRSGG
jgi:hypothetical protein